jgi:AraC family transcriptional regulator of adaptative response/methylated-DNA-[protein]-cysteine methyltransferase
MQKTDIQKIIIYKTQRVLINYSFSDTYFGKMLIASTDKGLFYTGFAGLNKDAFTDLKKRIPQADFTQQSDIFQQQAIDFLKKKTKQLPPFHLKGTDFQLLIWNALLKIPLGKTVTYRDIASWIGKPNACRAVGSAIGKNPVAVLIPCHRVVQTSGNLGGFYWGLDVKKKILDEELIIDNS